MKWLVFKKRGKYLKEYIRCNLTYLSVLIINLILLYLFVEFLFLNPFVAQCLATSINIVISYLGHKHFSFKY